MGAVKKAVKKMITVEVLTDMNNADLKLHVRTVLEGSRIAVKQVQVNKVADA